MQEFSYFLSGLDIQLEQSENDSPVCKKNWLQVAKYDKSYTLLFEQLIRTNGLVVKVCQSELGDLGSIPDQS